MQKLHLQAYMANQWYIQKSQVAHDTSVTMRIVLWTVQLIEAMHGIVHYTGKTTLTILSNSNKTIRNTISVSLLSVRGNTARDDSPPPVKLRRLQGDVKQSAMYRGIISKRAFSSPRDTGQFQFANPAKWSKNESIQPSQLPEREKMSTGLKNNPHFYEPMSSAAREYVNVCQRENRSRIAQKVRLLFHILILLQFPPVWS